MRDNDTGELQVSDSTEKRDNIWEVVNNINYEREPLFLRRYQRNLRSLANKQGIVH